MPIETSIYNALLQKPKSVQDYDNEAMQAQTNRLALQDGQNKMADYQRGLAGEAALSKALASGGDVQNALAQGGFGNKALAYQKQMLDARKTQSDIGHVDAQAADLTQKTKAGAYDLERKKHDVALQEVTSFSTPTDAVASLNAHIAKGEMSPEEGAQLRQSIPSDPAVFKQWQMQTVKGLLDAKERMVYMAPTANTVATNNTSIATNAATNATSRANNASTNATTQRGQDMTDARTREATAATASAGKVPSGYRAKADGTLEAIPGGPADPQNKPMTETQGKASLFATRMDKADKIMGTLAADGTLNPSAIKAGLEAVPLIGGALGAAGNYAASGKQQQLEQAQRDFVNAVLRQESGAAIGASEFESAQKQYFPQRGDSAGVIKQKAENRRTAIEGMANMAGKGQGKVTPSAPAAPSLPTGWSVEVH